MSNIIYDRMQKQLYLLERSVRAMRADLENELVSTRSLGQPTDQTIPIRSAMETQLTSGKPFSPISPAPYEHFIPGLSFGYVGESAGNLVRVRGLSFERASLDNPIDISTCLVAEITVDETSTPDWLTFEVALEWQDIVRVKNLVAKFVWCFRSAPQPQLGNFQVGLRLKIGSEFSTHCTRSFPALDVPLEFSYGIDRKQWAELAVKKAVAAKLIILLPVASRAPYDFIVSHFEARGALA